jgi:nucleotide-binding universal stress UspA family protein
MKKCTIFVPMMDEGHGKIAQSMKSFEWLRDCKVDLVHLFQIESYPYIVPPYFYPSDTQRPGVDKAVKEILKSLAEKCGLSETNEYCLFVEDVKEASVQFIKDHPSDLVITAARGKHGIEGFFSSSFTDHLIKFSPTPVLALR